MTTYILSEHIQNWIQGGICQSVSAEVATEFGDFLNAQPWAGSGNGVDWNKIGASELSLTLDDSQRIDWLSSSCFRDCRFIVFWYSPLSACLACDSEFAVCNIEQAFWKAPGKRYIFGANVHDGLLRPEFEKFGEYDGADLLRASIK